MERSLRGEVFPESRGQAEMLHIPKVQDEREDMMRAVPDVQAIPRFDVMPSRGRRSQYDKSPRQPEFPSTIERIPFSKILFARSVIVDTNTRFC